MSLTHDVRKYRGFGFFTVMFFAYLYLPIAIVIFYSFNENQLATVWGGFSLRWYESALQNTELLDAVKTSLIVAAVATIVATTCALTSALVIVHGRNVRFRRVSEAIVNLPLMLPEIVLAVAVLILFSQIGLSDGMTKLMIAHSTFCIPFAFLPIRARLKGLPTDFEEASADLYANRWTTFRRVTLPIIFPGVAAGAMLAFVISMDDFITSNMLNSGGSTTLPVYIFGLIRLGVTPELNAISTIIIVVSIILVSAAALIGARAARGTGEG